MIYGLIAFAAFTVALLYIAAIFIVGNKLQDWAARNGLPDIAIPWVFTMMMLFGLPISIAVAVSS